jgi:hypothetical protein
MIDSDKKIADFLKIHCHPSVCKWWSDIQSHSEFRLGKGKLMLLLLPLDARLRAFARIISACHGAKKYLCDEDPGIRYRRELQKLQEDRHRPFPRPSKTLEKMRRRARSGATPTWVVGSAPRAEDESLLPLNGGPFLHNKSVGNLLYPNPIRHGRRIEVRTMLAWEICLHMRELTASVHRRDVGRAFPRSAGLRPLGDPCYSIVAAFCNGTFPDGTGDALEDGASIKSRVRRIPWNMGLLPWTMSRVR